MFSELVDEIVKTTGKINRQTDIASYINASVRECAVLKTFYRDQMETQLTIPAEPFIWTYPSNFRGIQAAKLPADFANAQQHDIYFKSSVPGRRQQDLNYFYYGIQDAIVFSGGSTGSLIDIAWFRYPWPLNYYAVGSRPAVYDQEEEIKGNNPWTYLPEYDTDDTQRELARELVSNWLLLRWKDLIREGANSKLFRLQDESEGKSRGTFGLYKNLQQDLMRVERSVNLVEQADYAEG